MMVKGIERLEVRIERLEEILERVRAALGEEDHRELENLVKSYVYLTGLLEDKRTTIRELRRLLFGRTSEKMQDVLEPLEKDPEGSPAVSEVKEDPRLEEKGDGPGGGSPAEEEKNAPTPGSGKKKRQGHGRNGASAYRGADKVEVRHESLQAGEPCPEPGCKGKVYKLPAPRVLVRVVGRSPLGATVYELETLRCNLCLKVFTAKVPDGVAPGKYDETAASMIAVMRYGTGVPFHRLQGLQGNLGIPLPVSTQWDLVNEAAKKLQPAYAELRHQAAQGDVLHNDDTPMTILELMKKKEPKGDDG